MTATAHRLVHPFRAGSAETCADRNMLGGKGAGLARMAAFGVPVPPGFTLGTGAWRSHRDGELEADTLRTCLTDAVAELERASGRRLGDPADPLLVSVRSGAPVSMPGMMDTVLNVGLTGDVRAGLAARGASAFAADLHRRLLRCVAETVRGVPADELARITDPDNPRTWDELLAAHGGAFPDDPMAQLEEAVHAVWRSWDTPRARRYRRYRGIGEEIGTAVTVQAMVFGNRDHRSGTGVVFTRDPATGCPGAYGDFLPGAQGEDVVSGGTTPEPIGSAADLLPEAFAELNRLLPVLERAHRDMCDIEFTIESGRLWILQARVGQRSGAAALRIACDLVDEGMLDQKEALRRIPVAALQERQAPVRAPGATELPELGRGVAASPGTAVGAVVFDPGRAEELAAQGRATVLVRPETSPQDVGGMIAARGVVTAAGGRASHAAVVALGLGRPAVCGVPGLVVDPDAATFPGGVRLGEGEVVTVDGDTGEVLRGAVALVAPGPDDHVRRVLGWCAERAAVPVLDGPPPDSVTVGDPEDAAAAAGGTAVVDLDWEGSASVRLLATVCAALTEAGCRSWVLALPPELRGADPDPPPGPWRGVVAPQGGDWAATLLAARTEMADLADPRSAVAG